MIQYSTVQYSTVQYSTEQYSAVHYSTVQCSYLYNIMVQQNVVFISLSPLLLWEACCEGRKKTVTVFLGLHCTVVQYSTVKFSTVNIVEFSTVQYIAGCLKGSHGGGHVGCICRGLGGGDLEGILQRELARELGGFISNQVPLYYSSTQPEPSLTLLLLNSTQTIPHSNFAQLSPDQAPLYYCSTQPKPSSILLLLNSNQMKSH